MILTHSRFLRYREAFYKKVIQSPQVVELVMHQTEAAGEDVPARRKSLLDFVGDSPRIEKGYLLHCLYEHTTDPHVREKRGLNDEVSGVVYLAPQQLKALTGKETLDRLATKIKFRGAEFIVDSVVQLEPFFGTCISVEVRLKTSVTKG